MKITKKDVIAINQEFDKGIFHNEGSLDFTLDSIKNNQDWLEQTSFLLRALIADHVFQDGNKRTATNLLILALERQDIKFHPDEIPRFIIKLAQDNVKDIREIKKRIINLIY